MRAPTSFSSNALIPTALYTSEQVYAMEQAWFNKGYSSFALMQQAAWLMTQCIIKYQDNTNKRAVIWVGQGNNGGDGWLIALYLQQASWQVQVVTIGSSKDKPALDNLKDKTDISDAIKAQRMALAADCPSVSFEGIDEHYYSYNPLFNADVHIDALFGIGLSRAPIDSYKQAIITLNQLTIEHNSLVISVDIPSGLIATTGQVFKGIAVRADVTFCLIARKIGLHIKDGMDYSGEVIDIPLIPIEFEYTTATGMLLKAPYACIARQNNSHKGSYGHVLIIGGNQVSGSQGMGGAALLAASSAMATGAGKITVACHNAFHSAIITSLPDAMTIDLHNKKSVNSLIGEASVIAIGMGLGRDKTAQDLFTDYLQTAIIYKKAIIIDADGLYHLASLQRENHEVVLQLKAHSQSYRICLTPHSGEAARLLNIEVVDIENNRIDAIKQCAETYGGDWVLKGAGSLVLECQNDQNKIYICEVGNAGMATAGMGDVLAGVVAGLLSQEDLVQEQDSLRQAVLLHGKAGEVLVESSSNYSSTSSDKSKLFIGERGLQAQDMPAAIRHVMSRFK